MQNLDWKDEARKFFWLLLAAFIIGWLTGVPGWTLLAAALAYIAWNLRQLHRLQRWLADPAYDEPPQAGGIWGEVLDAIHRRQRQYKEEHIRLQRVVDYLRDSFASIADAVVMIDPDGAIDWSNHASERLLGLHHPEDSGQQLLNLIRSPDFIDYYEGGDYSHAFTLSSPANPALELNCQITCFGKGSLLLFARDITENSRLQQMRSDFVANVSHELRTPLTVICGYLDHFLSVDQVDERQAKAFKQMFAQANRMERLIKDLLLLSRLESVPDSSQQQDIDVLAAMATIREEILAAFKGERTITLEGDASLRLVGSWEELQSAFSNLVMNAAKYTESGGHINIRWYSDDDNAYLQVEDDGVGIDSHHLPRLTERFYRVDKSRSIDTGGTGLGLAIVKHVLMRHNAELLIDSRSGAGSSFSCAFPLSQTFIEQVSDSVLS